MMNNQHLVERDGGQRGCAVRQESQSLTLSNHGNADIENITEFGLIPNQIRTAGMWLHQHRNSLTKPVIPVLRERFGLSNLEAIQATKVAHAFAYPRA